jgi:hypothetical protein
MEIKILDYKKHNQISLKSIFEKYDNSIPIKFNSDELKSILSIFFSLNYHYPNVTKENRIEVNHLLSEKNSLFNITRDFGRHMIENLEDFDKQWLINLESNYFQLDKLFRNQELFDFTQMALVDYMTIRNREFGKYFINEYSKIIINPVTFESSSFYIKSALEKENDSLKKIAEKIIESNANLETHESLLLVITLQEKLMNDKVSNYSYSLVSYIVKENAFELNLKVSRLKETLNKSLNFRWGKGKGRGL